MIAGLSCICFALTLIALAGWLRAWHWREAAHGEVLRNKVIERDLAFATERWNYYLCEYARLQSQYEGEPCNRDT